MGKHQLGLYKKFSVSRNDGKSEPGEKHENCQYFVLDITHDHFAIPALKAYAKACAMEYPLLARDLVKIIGEPIVVAKQRKKKK